MERIRGGVEKNRWWQGQLVGVDTVFSDRLLMHMLNRTDPDRVAALRAAADAVPAPASLPMVEDFIVAAATATGELGWDPDADEPVYDDELVADMAAARAGREAAQAETKRLRDLCDALPKCSPEETRQAEFRAAQNRVAAGEPGSGEFDRMLLEDAAIDRQIARLARVSTLTTLDREMDQPRKSSIAAKVSSGASSGRK